jgi:hypothetical protein
MNKTKTKKPLPYLDDRSTPREGEKEEETEDFYDTGVREQMVDNDDITAAEEGFMMGREQEPQTRKKHVKNQSVMLTLFRLN